MGQENRYAALSTYDVYFNDSSKRSRISYTRSFLLSLAKDCDRRATVKLLKEIQLAMACAFENSPGLLPSPYCDYDSVYQHQQQVKKDFVLKDLDKVNLLHMSTVNKDSVPKALDKVNLLRMSTVNKDSVPKALDKVNLLRMSTVNKDSAPKALDKVNLLHKSSAPYLPPCRNRALSSSTGDSNGSPNGDISGSFECTTQKQAEPGKCGIVSPRTFAKRDNLWECYKQDRFAPIIPDDQIHQESELKSSNVRIEDCSTVIPGLCLPDEDSLIAYDGPFLNHEMEISLGIDSFMSAPESNLTEDDDLDSQSSTFDMIMNLVEFVLDDSDDDYDSNFECDDSLMDRIRAVLVQHGYDVSLMDRIMAELVQHEARLGQSKLSNPWLSSNQLNPGSDQQDDHNCFLRSSTDPAVFSQSKLSCPCRKIYEIFLSLGAGVQQGIMPPQLPSLHKVPYVRGVPDSHGDDDRNSKQAVVNSFKNMNLGASQFLEVLY
ncbi:hypothetical protein MtrunA17_Chr1g0202591 [Medicago truncatula]|uniref:Uncharacterized protein n=1 Tax=Medicago truncatula TaxID=3880 RepID=A0A396K7B7_MEDTR|nr:uncharacterized protein LOC25485054 [Medicago truncatula]RHN81757.1 hypothetical protein MtrunA17_Chr1g0202591 [Medicago truncatula]